MRNLIISLLSLLPFATAAADNIYDGVPFSMAQVEKPQIPSYTVCITDFGGKSDGTTLNTEAFRKAMAHLAEKGGGKLIVPAGLWHTGPIEMKSHTELHLEDGALIVFTADRSQYPLIDTYFEGVRSRRCMSPLTAHNVTDIAITGRGTINANGQAWRPVKKGKMTAGQWDALLKEGVTNKKGDVWFPTQDIHDANTDKTLMENAIKTDTKEAWAKVHDSLRPALLSIVGCKRVMLKDATFENSPGWNIHPLMSSDITIEDINVRNPWYAQNGDGLDLESCRNVTVCRSVFDVGDDAICMKSGRDKEGRDRNMPTENVIVKDCRVYHGHGGFVVGSEMSGGVRNIWVKNCQFIGTDIGLRFKSTRGRGGVVENIFIDGVYMANMPGDAMTFDLYYAGANPGNNKAERYKVDETTPSFRKISIQNVTILNAKRCAFINGLPEMPVQDIVIKNSSMSGKEGIYLNCVNRLTLDNVKITAEKTDPVTRTDDTQNITIR